MCSSSSAEIVKADKNVPASLKELGLRVSKFLVNSFKSLCFFASACFRTGVGENTRTGEKLVFPSFNYLSEVCFWDF